MFSDFCSEIGVADIREYEQDYMRQQDELEQKRYDLFKQHRIQELNDCMIQTL